jgi:hypothetical protein
MKRRTVQEVAQRQEDDEAPTVSADALRAG